jgi:hypothetical protein
MKAARARGIRPGPKAKLTRQQVDHRDKKLIENGQRREDVADRLRRPESPSISLSPLVY